MILASAIDGPADAPVVVMAGSLGTTRDMWRPQVFGLAGRYRLVRLDVRGHGASPVPAGPYTIAELGQDVLDTMDDLGIERAHWVGLSIGGMIGQWLGANAPQRFERLALLFTTAVAPDPALFHERAAAVRAAGSAAGLVETLLPRWLTAAHRKAYPEDGRWLGGMVAACPAEGYAACCEAIAAMDLRPEHERITAPTLVVGGTQDGSMPPEHARAVAERIAGAEYVELDPAGHLGSVERAADLNVLLDRFLGADPQLDAGMRVRRSVLGDDHVDRAVAATTDFTRTFQDFITRTAWGSVWTRDELDRRTRSCITIAVTAALGRDDELALHIRGARNNGVTPEEIAEVLLHTALYAGIPAANRAFKIAGEILDGS